MSQELTYSDVSEHSSKKDVYVVIHDKVYDATSFVDEHPGGEEVLLDVGGQDATEAFEDVGHSDEAREILEGLKIGSLKRQPGDPEPKATTSKVQTANNTEGGLGFSTYALLLVGVIAAIATYQYLQSQNKK